MILHSLRYAPFLLITGWLVGANVAGNVSNVRLGLWALLGYSAGWLTSRWLDRR